MKKNKKNQTQNKKEKLIKITKVEKNPKKNPKKNPNKRKRKLFIPILITLILILAAILIIRNQTSYKGYWCRYEETATIIALLKDNHTEAQKEAIKEKINKFEDIAGMNFYTKEDYAEELGGNVNEMDIRATFIITFSSADAIGTYIEELKKLDGVEDAKQSYAKTNIALYNIKSNKKYTFTNSDEAEEEDLVTGKYKEKNGVITFTPDDKDKESKLLYLKDNLLCQDSACEKIFFKSNETCTPLEK